MRGLSRTLDSTLYLLTNDDILSDSQGSLTIVTAEKPEKEESEIAQ